MAQTRPIVAGAPMRTALAVVVAATALVVTPPPAPAATARPTALLTQGTGMRSQPSVRVRVLQRALVRQGYSVGAPGVDGRFGPLTAAAVRRLQADHRLAVDGIVGPRTRRALRLPVHAPARDKRPTRGGERRERAPGRAGDERRRRARGSARRERRVHRGERRRTGRRVARDRPAASAERPQSPAQRSAERDPASPALWIAAALVALIALAGMVRWARARRSTGGAGATRPDAASEAPRPGAASGRDTAAVAPVGNAPRAGSRRHVPPEAPVPNASPAADRQSAAAEAPARSASPGGARREAVPGRSTSASPADGRAHAPADALAWPAPHAAPHERGAVHPPEPVASVPPAARKAAITDPAVVDKIAAMRGADMTLQAIADRLNGEHSETLPRNNRWRPADVRAALTRKRRQ